MDALESQLNERLRPLKKAEYLKLHEWGAFDGERVELVRGRVVRMAPMGTPHAQAVQKLNMFFAKVFGAHADVRVQLPLLVSDDTLPQPDFSLVDPEAVDVQDALGGTLLVVEISETSLRYDLEVKSVLYAEAGAPEYWVVNLRDGEVEVFRGLREGAYRERLTKRPGESVRCARFPDVEVPVSTLVASRGH